MSTQFVSRKKSKKSKKRKAAAERPADDSEQAAPPSPDETRRTAIQDRLGLRQDLRPDSVWFRHVRQRKRPRPLTFWLGGGRNPVVCWGIRDTFLTHPALAELNAAVRAAERTAAEDDSGMWNAVAAYELARQQVDETAARTLRDLHCLQHSPQLPTGSEPARWWQIIENALGWCDLGCRAEVGNEWLYQLWRVEFPVTLAYLYPEFVGLDSDVDDALLQFENQVATGIDPSGLPHPDHWPDFRALLASWTRSARLFQALRRKLQRQTWNLLSASWRQTIRASRPDGSQLLLAPQVSRGFRAMARLATELPLKRRTAALVAHAVAAGKATAKLPKGVAKLPLCEAPDSGLPWIMQSRWGRRSEKIAVWADATRQQLEVTGRVPLLDGAFHPLLTVEGHPLSSVGAPHTSCWYADPDVQVLELRYGFERDVQLDRLILLAIQDRIALVADTVTMPTVASAEYQLQLPLAAGVTVDQEDETREHYLRAGGKIQALALPLAVPEWQSARSPHRFAGVSTVQGTALQLTQQHTGSGLHAAVWLDLDPERSRQPRTWRQLTVAKDLTIQPGDRAVAYRVRSGNEQWLLYRRINPELSCFSALGWHFNCELYFGKIQADQSLRELVRIDWPPVDAT